MNERCQFSQCNSSAELKHIRTTCVLSVNMYWCQYMYGARSNSYIRLVHVHMYVRVVQYQQSMGKVYVGGVDIIVCTCSMNYVCVYVFM